MNHLGRLIPLSPVFAALCFICACGGKKEARPTERDLGSPLVYLETTEITSLGSLEGPYVFIKALAPDVVQLASFEQKTEAFKLIGLRAGEYPPPPPEKGKTPVSVDPEAVQKKLQALG